MSNINSSVIIRENSKQRTEVNTGVVFETKFKELLAKL